MVEDGGMVETVGRLSAGSFGMVETVGTLSAGSFGMIETVDRLSPGLLVDSGK